MYPNHRYKDIIIYFDGKEATLNRTPSEDILPEMGGTIRWERTDDIWIVHKDTSRLEFKSDKKVQEISMMFHKNSQYPSSAQIAEFRAYYGKIIYDKLCIMSLIINIKIIS